MTRQRVDTVIWWASFLLCGLVLVAHFSVIQLSNMPMSPLKLKMSNRLSSYVNPFFTQRWNFFAPQPIDHDYALLARGRYRDPQSAQVVTGDWVDVSGALIAAVRKNRLTPLFHIEICLSNALVDFTNNLGKNPRSSYEKEGKNYIKPEIPADVDPANAEVLRRVAMATLEITYPSIKFDDVQLGLMVYEFPRFTERQKVLSDLPPSLVLVSWQPASWVAPYCCRRQVE